MFQYQDFLKLQSYALFVVVHVADVVAFDVAHDGIECLWKACPVLALVLEEKICKHTKKTQRTISKLAARKQQRKARCVYNLMPPFYMELPSALPSF